MRSRIAALLLLVLALVSPAAVLAWPSALPGPNLAARDFRNGAIAVPSTEVTVIGLGEAGGVFVVGAFDSVDGQDRPYGVARLKSDGTLDAAWMPTLPYDTVRPQRAFEGPSGTVALVFAPPSVGPALVLVPAGSLNGTTIHTAAGYQTLLIAPDSTLYAAVGGSSFFGPAEADVLRFAPDGTLDPAFALHVTGDYNTCTFPFGQHSVVKALRLLEGYLYVVGNFMAESNPRGSWGVGGAVRVSPASGDADDTWHPMGSSVPHAMKAAQEKLTCFPQPTGIVNAILPGPNQTVYLGGSFQRQGRASLARFSRSAPGAVDPTWNPPATFGESMALDPSGDFVYVAGSISGPNSSLTRQGLVAFRASDGAVDPAWDPYFPGAYLIMATADRLIAARYNFEVQDTYLVGLPFASSPPTGALITLSPRPITLGVVPYGSGTQFDITVGSTGDAPLVIQSIDLAPLISGDPSPLSQTNDCAPSVAPGGTCTIHLTLSPPAYLHPVSVPMTVTSNGSGTPQVVYVSWTAGVGGFQTPDGRVAAFALTPQGSTRTITRRITSAGSGPLSISGISASGPAFGQTNDCPASLAPNATCTLSITYSPQSAGLAQGSLVVTFGEATEDLPNFVLTQSLSFNLSGNTATPTDDSDGDGMLDDIEATEGRNPVVKDNDVFASGRLFAMQQYRDFLAREGDSQGVDFWSGQVNAGAMSRGQVILYFLDSAEFGGSVAPVARLYFAYFLRVPDYPGLNFWTGHFRAGNSLESISNLFAGSAEFQQRYGSLDNGQFVDLVYQNVLGRTPDPGGRAFWKGQLDSGSMSRGQVMLGFSESEEYRGLIAAEVYVTMSYIGMLRRAPEPGGFSFWVGFMDAGNSPLALVEQLLGSQEYRNRFLP